MTPKGNNLDQSLMTHKFIHFHVGYAVNVGRQVSLLTAFRCLYVKLDRVLLAKIFIMDERYNV